jgi:hypothetical protein
MLAFSHDRKEKAAVDAVSLLVYGLQPGLHL